MPEIGDVLCPPAITYAAAAVGVGVALILRAGGLENRAEPSARDAARRALLPAAALVVLPLLSALPHDAAGPLVILHDLWHRLERWIQDAPAAHSALHIANWCLLLVALVCLLRAVRAAAQMRAFGQSLRGVERCDTPAGSFLLVPSERVLCFTLGLRRPATYLTTALLRQLTRRDLQAVLAHEAAHVARRDGWTAVFLALFYTLLPLPGSGALVRDWRRAVERECDAEAARRIGSRSDVAQAIVRVAAAMGASRTMVPGGCAFEGDGDDVEGRVRALLAGGVLPSAPNRAIPMRPWAAVIGAAVLLASGLSLHHVVALIVHH